MLGLFILLVLIDRRAYIAASRRSDRSIEARVESARRASEIHKKRTGRSLKVTEADVQNEEMYEEEDDDLPMQYRRFSALNPGQPYSAFQHRVQNYMTGQVGMRNYLHEAIYNANQNTAQQKYFNALMQQQQQQQQQSGNDGFVAASFQNAAQVPWSPNQSTQPEQPVFRTESFSYSPAPKQEQSPTFTPDARNMSLSLPSPGSRRHGNSSSASRPTQQPNQSPQRTSTSSRHSVSSLDELDPFSATLPANQQQLLDGNPAFTNVVHPSQMTPGLSMPSNYHHQFDILSKTNNTPGSEQFAFGQKNLNQTFTTQNMQGMQYAQNPASSMPTESDFSREMAQDSSWFDDSALFDFDRNNSEPIRPGHHSGQDTPLDANCFDDFFEFTTAST